MKSHIVFQVDVSGRSGVASFQVRRDDAGYHVGQNGSEFKAWPVIGDYVEAQSLCESLAGDETLRRIGFEARITIQRIDEVVPDFEHDRLLLYRHMADEHNRFVPYDYAIPELMPWLEGTSCTV